MTLRTTDTVMTHDTLKNAFVGSVLLAYILGEDNALEAYQTVYGNPRQGEGDIEFIVRCAEQDFDDAQYQGAIYQDVFDALSC